MIYKGQFQDIQKKIYTVSFIIGSDVTEKEIKLSTNPVVISTKSDGIFSPLKLREATITIINDEYILDLYSSTAQGVRVEISVNNDILFIGYVTPNAYSQGYNSSYEDIEIQAVEAISTLDNYDYSTTDYGIVTFQYLIDKCLQKCNCYTKYVYPKSLYLSASDSSDILSKLSISESNFFDDDEDNTPWKMKEVLFELMQYLGWSLCVYNNVVYMLDYSYIASGKTDYWQHTIGGNTDSITLSDLQTITSSMHMSTDSSISLSETYNKVAVQANLYKIEDLIPDLWNDNLLTNIYGSFNAYKQYSSPVMGMQDKGFTYFCKFYTNKKWENMYYNPVTHIKNSVTPDPNNYTWWKGNIGCVLCKHAHFDNREDKPASLTWDKYIYFSLGIDGHKDVFGPSSMGDFIKYYTEINIDIPILTIQSSAKRNFCMQNVSNKKSYIVLNGAIYENIDSWLINYDRVMDGKISGVDDGWPILLCKLQVGNKYWNGSKWTTTDSTFSVNCGTKNQKFLFEWLQIRNKVTYDMGIDEEGYCIPVSNDDKLYGLLTFTIYRPKPVYLLNGALYYDTWKWEPKYLIAKDITLKLCTPTEDWTDKSDTDTEYSNIIDESYVNEMDAVELKINSQTSKDYSYSSVLQADNGGYTYNKSLYNNVISKTQLQEYNLIETMYNHFCSPKVILSMDLSNTIFPYSRLYEGNIEKTLMVDSIETNLEQCTSKIDMYEI